MKKAALTIMLLTIITKIIGFSKDIVLSYLYGTSYISDAYLIAMSIPGFILTFVGAAIKTTYMPIYTSVLKEKGQKAGIDFTNKLINILILVATIIIVIILLIPGPVVKIFASGFEGETLKLTITLTKISIFSIYFFGILFVLQGYLQLKNNFVIPTIAGLPYNIILTISIFLSNIYSVTILALGKIVAVIVQLGILLFYSYKEKYRYRPIFSLSDKNINKMLYLAGPVVLGTSVNEINRIVDKTIASGIAVGGISALNYADRLNVFVQGIFIMSISTVFYAQITKMASEKNWVALKKALSEAINVINVLVIPVTIGTMLFAEPIVEILFDRGAFDSKAVNLTSSALFFYSIGMIGFGLREILSRVFYSIQDTKTPMINATIGMLVNVVLNLSLSKYFGISGIAFATSISASLTAILLGISLRKKIGSFGIKSISITFFKIIVATIIMAIIAKFTFNYINTNLLNQNTSLLFGIMAGVISYFGIIYFMKIEDVDIMINAVRRKFNKKKR